MPEDTNPETEQSLHLRSLLLASTHSIPNSYWGNCWMKVLIWKEKSTELIAEHEIEIGEFLLLKNDL